ncbi:hypothetical protein HQQ81_06800 [Microbacteriaceae bacterium VKM Ac-2854]|nr:hypothetical protein [Microbacteriaceae bacterium VKM Ac-2854]
MRHHTPRLLRRIPATLGFALLLMLAAVETGTVVAQPARIWAVGVPTTLLDGAWWTPFSALIVPEGPAALIAGLIIGVPLLAVAERRVGSWRIAASFVATGAAAAVLGVALQWADSSLGAWFTDPTRLPVTLDPLTPVVGAFLTATAFFGPLWRRRARVLTLAAIVMLVLNDGDPANGLRLIAALAGLTLGLALTRGQSRRARSSPGERRRLLAALVAASASGPLIALLSRDPIGPSAEFGRMLALPDAAVIARCADTLSAACNRDLAAGPGPALLAVVPSVLLVVAAVGMLRGRRLALRLAVGVQLAVAAFGFAALDAVSALERLSRAGAYGLWAAAAVLLPVLLAIVALTQRRLFRLLAPPSAAARWGAIVLLAFIALAGAFMVVNGTGPLDTARRFIPATLLAEPIAAPRELLLFATVGPLFWAVVLLAVLRVSRASARLAAAARRAVRDAGGGVLGYRGLAGGARLWRGPTGSAVVFRVVDRVALVFGAPEPPAGFSAFCAAKGWSVAIIGEAPAGARAVLARQYVLSVASLRAVLDDSPQVSLRTLWTRWEDLGARQRLRVEALAAQNPALELGAFFGADDAFRDPDAALLILFDDEQHPLLLATWWPILRGRRTIGWGLESVHRTATAPDDAAQIALAAVRSRLREDGAEVLALLGPAPAETPLARVIDRAYRALEPSSGGRSFLDGAQAAGATSSPIHLAGADSQATRVAAVALLADADARSLRIAGLLPASGESANGVAV